jgi:hypothetical protein
MWIISPNSAFSSQAQSGINRSLIKTQWIEFQPNSANDNAFLKSNQKRVFFQRSGGLVRLPGFPCMERVINANIFRVLTFNNIKVEYTDFSRLNRLRLEDSFLPGALQNPIS